MSVGEAFDAVAGHPGSIFYGPNAGDGRRTLQKNTTVWEVMFYLAIYFHDDITSLLKRTREENPCDAVGSAPRASLNELVEIVSSVTGMADFTAPLFSVRFPAEGWPVASPSLLAHLGQLSSHAQTSEYATSWLCVHDKRWCSLWAPLFVELYTQAVAADTPVERTDAQNWGLGLVDLTSHMRQPAVMDVKIGFVRTTPFTPAAKVKKIHDKERGTTIEKLGLRISGLRRYVHDAPLLGGADPTTLSTSTERLGKAYGFALRDEGEVRLAFRAFFSVRGALVLNGGEGTAVSHCGRTGLQETELQIECRRRAAALEGVRRILFFYRDSCLGQQLRRYMSIVASSLLFVFDAADDSTDRVLVRHIDLARSGCVKLNYSDEVIGFIRGLENLERLLC